MEWTLASACNRHPGGCVNTWLNQVSDALVCMHTLHQRWPSSTSGAGVHLCFSCSISVFSCSLFLLKHGLLSFGIRVISLLPNEQQCLSYKYSIENWWSFELATVPSGAQYYCVQTMLSIKVASSGLFAPPNTGPAWAGSKSGPVVYLNKVSSSRCQYSLIAWRRWCLALLQRLLIASFSMFLFWLYFFSLAIYIC